MKDTSLNYQHCVWSVVIIIIIDVHVCDSDGYNVPVVQPDNYRSKQILPIYLFICLHFTCARGTLGPKLNVTAILSLGLSEIVLLSGYIGFM